MLDDTTTEAAPLEKENDEQEFIEFLEKYSDNAPSIFFERDPSKESTTVRTMNFILKSIVSQLAHPINIEAEATTKWLIYKQAGPHRHQKFFGHFRQMNRFVAKYNDMTLIKKLNPVLRKAENCSDKSYKLEYTAIRYIACAYVKRVYQLEKIREACIKCANAAIGLLELDHWINLSLVVIALCSDIHSDVISQVIEMENVYKTAANVFRTVDSNFPLTLNNLEVVRNLKEKSGMFDDRKISKSHLSAISRLLKYSPEKMEEALAENILRMKTTDELVGLLSDDINIISPPKFAKEIMPRTQLDMSDMGISVSRENASFLNTTDPSCFTVPDINTDESEVLFSRNSCAPKNLKKKRKGLKRKSELHKAHVEQKKSSFLSSTLDLISTSSCNGSKKRKKQKM